MDVYYDQCIIGAYGLASVEASIFNSAIFCKLNSQVLDVIKKETGLVSPFIQWETEQELKERSYALVKDPKIRAQFGKLSNTYCKAVHDEKPVAERFIKTVEGM
jgi:hypothetical protein